MAGYLHHRCCCALNYKLNMKVLLFSFIFISFLFFFFLFLFNSNKLCYAKNVFYKVFLLFCI